MKTGRSSAMMQHEAGAFLDLLLADAAGLRPCAPARRCPTAGSPDLRKVPQHIRTQARPHPADQRRRAWSRRQKRWFVRARSARSPPAMIAAIPATAPARVLRRCRRPFRTPRQNQAARQQRESTSNRSGTGLANAAARSASAPAINLRREMWSASSPAGIANRMKGSVSAVCNSPVWPSPTPSSSTATIGAAWRLICSADCADQVGPGEAVEGRR